ncbi:hypothetical protein SAMN05428941_5510 [Streptomyces sp. 2114.2]|nr:hypothetical protein BX268_5516 [Streptomyces sp. 2221.1]SDT75062.1 hypothetical protein SAMN05428941_5510 [Streptomyces sp. 2114.2]
MRGGAGRSSGAGFLRPRRPFPSRPWGRRPQTPAFGLNGLVLKRRTGRGLNGLVLKRRTGWGLNGLVLKRRTGWGLNGLVLKRRTG